MRSNYTERGISKCKLNVGLYIKNKEYLIYKLSGIQKPVFLLCSHMWLKYLFSLEIKQLISLELLLNMKNSS